MKKLAAARYLTLFRDLKLARMIKTYRSASCHQVLKMENVTYISVISKIIKQYFDIKLSKGLLDPNPLWNSADIYHIMKPFKVHLIRNVCSL